MVRNQRPFMPPNIRRPAARTGRARQRRFTRMMQDANGEIDLSGLLHKFIDELQNLNNSVNELRQVSRWTQQQHNDDDVLQAAAPRRSPQQNQKRRQRAAVPVKRLQRREQPQQATKCVRCRGTMVRLSDGTYTTAVQTSEATTSCSGASCSSEGSEHTSDGTATSLQSNSSPENITSTTGGATSAAAANEVSKQDSKAAVPNPELAGPSGIMNDFLLTESQLSTVLTQDPPYAFQNALDAFIYLHANPQFDK